MAIVTFGGSLYDSTTGKPVAPESVGAYQSEGQWYTPSNEGIMAVYELPETTLRLASFNPATASAPGLPAGMTRDANGNAVAITSLPGEEQQYQAAGFTSDQYQNLLATPDSQQTPAETWLEQHPGALGQYLTRWQPQNGVLTPFTGQPAGWNYSPEEFVSAAITGTGAAPVAGIDPNAGERFISEQSAEAQARRDAAEEKDDLRSYAMIAAAVIGGAYLGAASGAAGATTTAAAGTGGLTAAQSTAMFGTADFAGATAAAAPATTGGLFVGTKGLVGSTGYGAIADAALNGAIQNAVLAGATGGDVGKAALLGGVGGGAGALVGDAAGALGVTNKTAAAAINAGAQGAVSGGLTAAMTGRDIGKGALAGGLSRAGGTYASLLWGDLTDNLGGKTASGAISGGIGGAIYQGVTGGDVKLGAIAGALGGAAGGAMSDMGMGAYAGLVGPLVGAYASNALNKQPTQQTTQQATTPTTTPNGAAPLSYTNPTPVFAMAPRKPMAWGTVTRG